MEKLTVDKLTLMDTVARTRTAAAEAQRLVAELSDRIRAMRASGENTDALEQALLELEAEYNRHMAEMERILDLLDTMESPANDGGSQA
jgi:hypothetical protein